MAVSIIATLLLVALAAASAPRMPNQLKWASNCQVFPCQGTLKDVKLSADVVEKDMEVDAVMIVDSTAVLKLGSHMRLVLYNKDDKVREVNGIMLDVPFPTRYLGFSLEPQAVSLPRGPGYVEFAFKAFFRDWQPSYHMLNVIIRNQDNDVVIDAKLILDDEASAATGDLHFQDMTPSSGPGWLEGVRMDPNPAFVMPDTTIRLDVIAGHDDELTGKAWWFFDLRKDDVQQYVTEWTLANPQPIEHGAMYLAMNPVSLPMGPKEKEFVFFVDFRFPSAGEWTLYAELFDENRRTIVRVMFFAGVHNP